MLSHIDASPIPETFTSQRTDESPFAELPQALVEEMLDYSGELSKGLFDSLSAIKERRDELRSKLKDSKLLLEASTILGTPSYPTSCGVDGSYAIERLLTTDLVVGAALAVEGLTPPSEKRFWPTPHHQVVIRIVPHNEATTVIIRAVMVCMELFHAQSAPHDVVFLDGSLATPLIYLNQGLSKQGEGPKELSDVLTARVGLGTSSYSEILQAPRSDKDYAAVPKYTSKKEIVSHLGLTNYEDRGLLSLILEPGELTPPLPVERPADPYHLPADVKDAKRIISLLDEIRILYFRPYGHMPAIRLEIPNSVAKNSQRLARVLEAVSLQCGAPGMLEPYPLYLADRMVKHLAVALPAIRQAATQEMAAGWKGDVGEVYMSMHGFRSEYGA